VLDRLLTVEEAAERLGTSVRFVRRLIAERRIAYVKLGRYVRLDPADVEALIAASRVQVRPSLVAALPARFLGSSPEGELRCHGARAGGPSARCASSPRAPGRPATATRPASRTWPRRPSPPGRKRPGFWPRSRPTWLVVSGPTPVLAGCRLRSGRPAGNRRPPTCGPTPGRCTATCCAGSCCQPSPRPRWPTWT
jgi:excisionase family DNA binding protein